MTSKVATGRSSAAAVHAAAPRLKSAELATHVLDTWRREIARDDRQELVRVGTQRQRTATGRAEPTCPAAAFCLGGAVMLMLVTAKMFFETV